MDLLIILTVAMFAVVAYSWYKSRTTEVASLRAVVMRKRFLSPDNYLVTFRGSESEVELRVSTEVYFANDEGQWGHLVYQGELFREFVPETTEKPRLS